MTLSMGATKVWNGTMRPILSNSPNLYPSGSRKVRISSKRTKSKASIHNVGRNCLSVFIAPRSASNSAPSTSSLMKSTLGKFILFTISSTLIVSTVIESLLSAANMDAEVSPSASPRVATPSQSEIAFWITAQCLKPLASMLDFRRCACLGMAPRQPRGRPAPQQNQKRSNRYPD